MTHKEFVEEYKKGNALLYITKNTAGTFVMSPLADKFNKPAHLFWTNLAFILLLPAPIILLFFNWIYSICSFMAGIMVWNASKKSAQDFVGQNMIEDERFCKFVLENNGAKISDKNGISIVIG